MTFVATKITCPADVYTALSAAEANVSLRIKTMIKTTVGRLALSASLPAANATDYVAVSDHKWKELRLLTGNVYFMPVGCSAVVEVVKG